jgi:hypothetical protein
VAWVGLAGILFLSTAGCGPEWKKKFVRKKKAATGPQPILVLQPDVRAVLPAADRYREHYAIWKSWHTELIQSYGQLRKRDLVHLAGVIGELSALHALLNGPPADELRKILSELSELKSQWESSVGFWNPSPTTRSRLEQIQRSIEKHFHYSRIKSFLMEDQSYAP